MTKSDQDPDGQPSPTSVVALPASTQAPALARQHLRQLAPQLDPVVLDDALVLTSELVTNAVLYGAPEITLTVAVEPTALTVIVADAGPELPPPEPTRPPTEATRGRGLAIVDAVADRWGIMRYNAGSGKAVWFRLVWPDG